MNRLVVNFQKGTNSVTVFAYLINVILISLLYNNPIITVGILIMLVIMSILTRPGKVISYLKFSSIIFFVTVLFNVLINQRGTNILWSFSFLKITQESLINGVILGISFVNLLWAFYIYDSLIRVKTIFELLSNFLKSIAVIFILTIKFIPEIIQIFTETQVMNRFRTTSFKQAKSLNKIKQQISLTEVVLNKSIAKFMNVSDTLILKGYEQRHKNIGWLEFKRLDWTLITTMLLSVFFNITMSVLKIGRVDFGSAKLNILSDKGIWFVLIINSCLILLPILIGGGNYLWWRFYSSKFTVSNTITAKDYR